MGFKIRLSANGGVHLNRFPRSTLCQQLAHNNRVLPLSLMCWFSNTTGSNIVELKEQGLFNDRHTCKGKPTFTTL